MNLFLPHLFLAIGSPSGSRSKRSFKIIFIPFGGKTDVTFRAMVFKTASRDKSTIACHGSGIMVAAFYFVKWISFRSMVPVLNYTGKDQALFDHTFRHQVSRNLMFKTTHTFMKIAQLPGHVFSEWFRLIMRVGIHDHSTFSCKCIRTSAGMGFNIGSHIHRKIILPKSF
ncbi:hypothetical protein D3C85_1243590 [compost metagenome]